MPVEIRPARPDEMPKFAEIVSSSLAMPAETFASLAPEWTLCAFDDGQLATAYAAWPFTMRMNGAAMRVAGVTTVSTDPLFRRRGNLRTIMETDFRKRHEQGEPIAALYASQAAIYQRYGYGLVSTHHRYTTEPRFLRFAQQQPISGSMRESSRDEFPLLVDLYRRFREPRTGYLHRGAPMWEAGVLAPPAKGDRLTILVYEEATLPLGYLVFTSGPGVATGNGPSQQIQVRDLSWLTPAAYRACWEHLARFDLVSKITWSVVPADDPLPYLLLEPRMLHDESHDGIYGRVIDVNRAFAGRGYGTDGQLVFGAVDPLCPWNEGAWLLETSGVDTSVTRSSRQPDFTAPIATLAMLLFGEISVTEAWRMGRLEAGGGPALARADTLLRTSYRPFCADHF